MLSENLKKIRKDNNLSQEQLAEKLGVSRQSVSKWENGEAYPEMDKVLQICKMFNLNIDELLNQDIKKVNEEKQSKINIDKYVGDFLDYITKSINLFASMKFRDKIKCLFEQCIIALIIFIASLIVGTVGSNLVHSILFFIPQKFYYDVYNIFSGFYILFAFIVGVMLLLHIFKVRYLDYYVVMDEKDEIVPIEKEVKEEKTFSRKEEKVIIRDPKDSKISFISLLVRSILFMIKLFIFGIGILFSFVLIALTFLFVTIFLINKSGFVFIGSLLIVFSAIIINLIILYLIYKFLRSNKSNFKVSMILFVISLILMGIGIGLFCMGLLDFKVIKYEDNSHIIEVSEEIQFKENMFIDSYYYIELIESNNSNLKIVYSHPDFYELSYSVDDNMIWFDRNNFDQIKMFNRIIDDFNNREITDYDNFKIKIYTCKENILKLRENKNKYYNINYYD